MKDKEILKLISSQDNIDQNKGLKIIYDSYFKEFEKYFQNKKLESSLIDDLFQDCVIALYMNARNSSFELTSSLKTYIISIGKNLWYKTLRQEKEYIDINGLSNIGIEDDYIELWYLQSEVKNVLEIMDHLPSSCKEILILFYVEKWKMKEIAIKTKLANEQVVRNKKHKCMSKLIELCKNES